MTQNWFEPTVGTRAIQPECNYDPKKFMGGELDDLPAELPLKFEFVVNLKTAKQIDLTVPPWLLMRAETVIKRS
jgi:putative ABC transport system substrate-binding protein